MGLDYDSNRYSVGYSIASSVDLFPGVQSNFSNYLQGHSMAYLIAFQGHKSVDRKDKGR